MGRLKAKSRAPCEIEREVVVVRRGKFPCSLLFLLCHELAYNFFIWWLLKQPLPLPTPVAKEIRGGKEIMEAMAVMEIPVMGMVAGDESPCNAEMMEANVCILKFCHGSRRLWAFPRFAGDCANGIKKYPPGTISDQKSDITDSCSQMILQLHDVYDPNKINVRIKIVSGSPCGAVAVEAKKAQADWVVLDKRLKHEEKRCMEELQCNIVVMKHSQPKVLRLNLIGPQKNDVEEASPSFPSEQDDVPEKQTKKKIDSLNSIKGPTVTPTSSPELRAPLTLTKAGTELRAPLTSTQAGTSSTSSYDPGTSPFFISKINGESKKRKPFRKIMNLVILIQTLKVKVFPLFQQA
ncbi:Inactive protein kinase [Sesbania bispinosa]|nr:Inactive protein kinase [Sesbania bispinosa]